MKLIRSILRRALRIAGAGLAVGLAALGVHVAANWTYIDRLRHHPPNLITNEVWYTPREPIPGGAGGGTPLPRARPEDDRIAPAALERTARLADAKNASALLVVHDGRVVLERHWRGHQPGTPTNSASMAKTITALLIGIALDEGKIRSLDQPAATWLPAWRDDARRKITLRHLLQMHSGLRPMGAYDDPYSDAAYLALGTDNRYVVDHVEVEGEPGVAFDYNNVDYQALGFVLEAATGRRYADYLSAMLWEPIGAAAASVWLDRAGGSARTFAYLFADPEDWAKVGLLLLREGRWGGRQILSRDYLRQMLTPSPAEPRYGLGIWLAHNPYQAAHDEERFLADEIFYLDGHSKQRVYVIPSRSLVVVRVGENGRGWDEAALPNAVLRALPAP